MNDSKKSFDHRALFVLDKEWQFVHVNKQAEQILKTPKRKLLQTRVRDVFPDVVGTIFQKNARKAMRLQKMVQFKAYFKPLSLWVEVFMYPNKDKLCIYFSDITAEKSALEKVKYYATLTQQVSDAIISTDDKLRIVSINRAAEIMYGWTEKEVIGKDCTDYLSPIKKEKERKKLRHEGKWEGEVIHKKKSGENFYVHATVSAIKNVLGEAIGYVSINKDITKEKLIEDQIRFQSNILENVTESILCVDLQGKIIYWNKGAKNTYGWEENEILGKHINMLYPENEKEDFEKYSGYVLQGNDFIRQSKRITKKGEVIWVDIKSSPLRDKTGKIFAIIGISRNITEQKESEEQLRYHARVIDNVSDAVISTDNNYRIVTWNKGAEQIYGWKENEVLGRTATSILHTVYLDGNLNILLDEIKKHGVYRIEVTQQRKDGEEIQIASTVSPMENATKQRIGFVVVNRNNTEQKKTEEKMKENEALFRRLVDANIIGISIAGPDGYIYEANDIYLSILGYSREEFFKKKLTWKELTPKEELYKDEQKAKELHEKGFTMPWEKQYIRKDGKRISVVIGAALLDKKTKKNIAFVLDITERKELEERKDDFIAITSHELKTPLTALGLYTHLLSNQIKKDNNQKYTTLLKKIEEQKDKLEKLITNLLDISKIQSGQLISEKSTFSLKKLITETADMLQQSTPTHKIITKTPSGDVKIYADKDRTLQVLINLLSNAIKYSPQGKKIIVTLIQRQDEIQVDVQDFGIGIEDEEINKLFNRFYRAGKGKEKTYPGLGIGLFLCSQIIARQGGKIWVRSEKGKGSIFSFSLPK